jgi:hypothetical protein
LGKIGRTEGALCTGYWPVGMLVNQPQQKSECRMSLPSVTLKAGQLACCPDCKQPQSDPVEDYLSATQSAVNDRCESCHISLRFIRTESGEVEIHARQTRAELLEQRRTLR